jgi:hypothetical protein
MNPTTFDAKAASACPATISNYKEDAHREILESYFFEWIDRGMGADETPLYTLRHGEELLCDVVARRFRLSRDEAVAAIEAARQEVAL